MDSACYETTSAQRTRGTLPSPSAAAGPGCDSQARWDTTFARRAAKGLFKYASIR